MYNIPNVSTVYREIAKLNCTDKMVFNNYQNNKYQIVTQKNNMINQYQYKQQKHNQLMQKLQLSKQYNEGLKQISPYNSIKFPLREKNQKQKSQKKWKPPIIKYRHLEDNNKSKNQIFNKNIKQQKLHEQFYETNQIKKKENQVKKLENGESESVISQFSQQKSWMNKQSKYAQKLQNYFQLCRKTTINIPEKQKDNKDKFMRKTAKINTMSIEKAMQLLSQ